MDIEITYLWNALYMAILLAVFFCLGVFVFRFSQSVNEKTIRHAGQLAYRLICKSGFIVLMIIGVTYAICKNEIIKDTKITSDGKPELSVGKKNTSGT